jgi:hypothetical protein
MVGMHGGSCTAHHYDVDSKHTASLASAALGIPFVAFNRLGYKDSATFLPRLRERPICKKGENGNMNLSS